MCGICGILFKDPRRETETDVLRRMCDTMRHRGPDDDGQKVLGRAGLGMRRLSIIDLDTGHQPMGNDDGSVWIVFNGEIYNFMELRRELEGLGYRFRTRSDTESILHGYEAWGESVFERLNGMFGIAIRDCRQDRLLLARDRLGIKPLYLYEDEEKWVFASEIKAILQCPGVRRRIDPESLDRFMTFEYIPAPGSIFKDIRKLPQGHYCQIRGREQETRPFWTLQPAELPWKEAEAAERLRELVRDSVRLRLISDVPLGAFLSGGIDSTTVVSQMAQLMDRPVKTFSIGFKESSYNELGYARAVADRYGTEHHEFVIEARALDLAEKLVGFLDEPLGDFSIFPTYLVSRMARDFVTVCLSGDGGDELFAGYDAYRAQRFDRQFYHKLPKVVKRRLVEPAARALPPTGKKKGAVNSFKRFIEGTRLPKSLHHARWMTFLAEEERRQLFHEDFFPGKRTGTFDFIERIANETEGLHDITRTGHIDVKSYLADDILVKVDRMSMAVSLEARVPLLDYRIVEFAFTLPPHLKMRGLRTKYLLKKTFHDDFPPEIRRRGKQGFSIPIKNWIRGDLKGMMTDLLAEKRLREQGFFNPVFIHQLMREHLGGRENHSHKLWALMVFQLWYDQYGGKG
jgi:asparagine synthase (glutamine-hydrolysing)